ncbi:Cuticle protein 7 [Orchesella cincta]|uniref:Cuticle protein 7 n=1 Tax=Orchesella cincta TaxID=48709 RepID=A0A1D2NGT5_ORCCI|nr:Cuticle protein 7 [Orchesella cincta]
MRYKSEHFHCRNHSVIIWQISNHISSQENKNFKNPTMHSATIFFALTAVVASASAVGIAHDIYAYPAYKYSYGVADKLTGDQKSAHEIRDGGITKGSYSLVQPDGVLRTVNYISPPTEDSKLKSSTRASLGTQRLHGGIGHLGGLGRGIGGIGIGGIGGYGLGGGIIVCAAVLFTVAYPAYKYSYGVADKLTGDQKSASEVRDGGVTKGSYSLVQPMASSVLSTTSLPLLEDFKLKSSTRESPLIQPCIGKGVGGLVSESIFFALAVVASAAAVEHQNAHPAYKYNYGVSDKHTGDQKSASEVRDGGVTKGSYSLVQPDGVIRTVNYIVTPHGGFQAQVINKGVAAHPAGWGWGSGSGAGRGGLGGLEGGLGGGRGGAGLGGGRGDAGLGGGWGWGASSVVGLAGSPVSGGWGWGAGNGLGGGL